MENPIETPRPYWHRYKNLPRNVWSLSLVSFLNDTSSEIIYPLLPTFLFLTLGASPFIIGLIEGIAETTARPHAKTASRPSTPITTPINGRLPQAA